MFLACIHVLGNAVYTYNETVNVPNVPCILVV